MHIGILTGGGDCPGLNAVIRAVTLALLRQPGTTRVSGVERGFLGLLARRARTLVPPDVAGILAQGGTILGTHNACDPFSYEGADRSDEALAFAREIGLDALIVIGGDGTMDIAHRFAQRGLPIVGVPKTIDNDLPGTERTFGFDSAVAVVAEALDRVATTARSHGRVMIVETMGRYAGWIALEGGIAGGADVILLPELPFSVDAVVDVARRHEAAGGCTVICIAEGARAAGHGLTVRERVAGSPDPLRLGGVSLWLQQHLQPLLQSEVRSTILGHTQRGGTPTAFDRVLATRFGWHAAELVCEGRFGRMVALQGDEVLSVAIESVAGHSRLIEQDHPLLRVARGTGVVLGA